MVQFNERMCIRSAAGAILDISHIPKSMGASRAHLRELESVSFVFFAHRFPVTRKRARSANSVSLLSHETTPLLLPMPRA
jgi:hypothetical protein